MPFAITWQCKSEFYLMDLMLHIQKCAVCNKTVITAIREHSSQLVDMFVMLFIRFLLTAAVIPHTTDPL